MREILFRGKAISGLKTGKWVFGAYANGFWCANKNEHVIIPTFIGGGYFEVIHETVGQYTGLKDKNGKRIFEGDIVKSCEYGDMFRVEYFGETNYPAFDCVPDVSETDCNGLSFLVNTEGCEVIGNIHDNPELLENEK